MKKQFKLRKGVSITHFVGRSVCWSKKFLYNYMHFMMDNPYISHSYMTYLMDMEEERKVERGGGGYNPTSKQSISFDGG